VQYNHALLSERKRSHADTQHGHAAVHKKRENVRNSEPIYTVVSYIGSFLLDK
jgi:hypothetical protein